MKTKFILFIVIIILFVIGLGVFMSKNQKPGKYDDFAKALKSNGAVFYGAFWCPHCIAEKALFGNSKKYLPYVECSNPNRSPTQICIDAQIESFPTWKFENGITIASSEEPTMCSIKPGKEGEDPICAQIGSEFYKTWRFPGYAFSVRSLTDPVVKDGVWKFESGSSVTGETSLEFLAQQIGYTLPQ